MFGFKFLRIAVSKFKITPGNLFQLLGPRVLVKDLIRSDSKMANARPIRLALQLLHGADARK
jgi:hypothetical protein